MSLPLSPDALIGKTIRDGWGRILSTLTRALGDLQLAEDSLQDAVVVALQSWPKNGTPDNPDAWLFAVARRKAIDRLRRVRLHQSTEAEIAYLETLRRLGQEEDDIPDTRLEMMFTCCHPAIEEKSQVALTLRTLGGLTTEEIASAYLDGFDAMQKRLTRAKTKIAKAGIRYKIPEPSDLPERLSSVLRTLYLMFNEGYAASSGATLLRVSLSDEAIRLGRMLAAKMPEDAEVQGLLALMLLHDARRLARFDASGGLITLEDQNRTLWSKDKIAEGTQVLTQALRGARAGPYQIQAAISALHCTAKHWDDTDWPQIAQLYEALHARDPTDVVRINQAVALAFSGEPSKALRLLDALNGQRKLSRYAPYHVARAEALFRVGRIEDAVLALKTAAEFAGNTAEKEFLTAKAVKFGQRTSH